MEPPGPPPRESSRTSSTSQFREFFTHVASVEGLSQEKSVPRTASDPNLPPTGLAGRAAAMRAADLSPGYTVRQWARSDEN